MAATGWKNRLDQLIKSISTDNSELENFARANASAIEGAVAGRGPDDVIADPEEGARMVVNISSVHVPAFCDARRNGDERAYKNGYDLGKYRIGDSPSEEKLKSREIVDRALPLNGIDSPADVYFGAVELNGAGIRFYGDVCLVLKRDELADNTVVLDRNSYDLIRAPLRDIVDKKPDCERAAARKNEAAKLAGYWKSDVGAIAAIKTLQVLGPRPRRYTTGQIAEAVRDDEDYMEVLKIGSFGTAELQEARLSAAEAAHDALISDRLRTRPAPRMEALMWRNRRRRAEEELRRAGVRVLVVTTSGRTKD